MGSMMDVWTQMLSPLPIWLSGLLLAALIILLIYAIVSMIPPGG
jgi:hypothetical protein